MSVAMMSSKIKSIGRNKEKKNKNKPPKPTGTAELCISGPKAAVNDGLYRKLAAHQANIMQQIEIITNSLETGLGDKKVDLSSVVTVLLRQLDSAVSTTQQCLTKEVYERNISLKPALGDSERRMYADIAFLVKWADFRSRQQDFALDKDLIYKCVEGFKVALNDIVKLVAQSVMALPAQHDGHLAHHFSADTLPVSIPHTPAGIPNRQRRASLTEGLLNRVVAGDDVLPTASLPAGYSSGSGDVSIPGIPTRARSVNPKHLMVNRDSLTSDSSTSGDSDLSPSRRGVSVERHETPDAEYIRDRSRTDGDVLDNPSYHHHNPHPHHYQRHPQTSPPASNIKFFTPPPQGRGGIHDSSAASADTAVRRQSFPTGFYTQQKSSSPPAVNGLGPGVDSTDNDQPPPIPPKMRKRAQMGNDPLPPSSLAYSMSSADPNASPQRRSHYDTIPAPYAPPPIPVKKKSQGSMGHASSPPPPLPQHSPQHSAVSGGASAPPVPLRLHSIPGLVPRLQNATGPAKPPRHDTETEIQAAAGDSRNTMLLQTHVHRIDQYNQSIKKAAETGEKPPLPVKKRTVLIYNQLMHMQNYTFDESIIPSMPIPDMTAPPPLPPKRRFSKKPPVSRHDGKSTVSIANGSPRHTSGMVSKYSGSGSQDDLDLSSEELDEKVNYLEVEDVTPYLTFNKEEEGLYTLRGGPLDALIAYAASTSSAVKQYTEAFLLTYYTIISPDELIKKLIQRLHFFYKDGNSGVWQATTSLLVRLINNLHSTLSREAEISLSELIHTMLTDGNLKFGQLIRDSLIAKLNQVKPDHNSSIPIGRALSSSTPRSGLLDLNPEQMAIQMSILDAEFFSKVDVSEMLFWAKQQNEEKCPQLTSFTMHFNNVSQWCKTRILERDLEFRKREKIVLHFIAIMKALKELSNFNSYLAILSAIESASVSRLDWSERVLKGLEEPRLLIDCTGSFKNYRQAFAQTKPPCIPYIGLYLKDLTALEEQPSKLEDGVSINFSKRWKQFKSVDHIRYAQSRQYSFQPDPNILSVFNNFDIFLTDDELWSLSHEIKPSGRKTAATASSN